MTVDSGRRPRKPVYGTVSGQTLFSSTLVSSFPRWVSILFFSFCIAACSSSNDAVASRSLKMYEQGDTEAATQLLEGLDTTDFSVNFVLASYYISRQLPNYNPLLLKKAKGLLHKIRISSTASFEARRHLILARAAIAVFDNDVRDAHKELSRLCEISDHDACLKSEIVHIQRFDDMAAIGSPRTYYEEEFYLNDMSYRLTHDTYYLANMIWALGHFNFTADLALRKSVIASGTYGESVKDQFCTVLWFTRETAPTKYRMLNAADIYTTDCSGLQ